MRFNPDSAEALHNRGNILARLKRFDDALESFNRSLAIKPTAYAQAWVNRGLLLQEMKRFGEAMESFTRALAIDPRDAAALRNRGKLAWMEFDDYETARDNLERAVANDPDFPDAQGDLLYLKMQTADWDSRAADITRLNEAVRAGKSVVEPFIYQGDQRIACGFAGLQRHPCDAALPARSAVAPIENAAAGKDADWLSLRANSANRPPPLPDGRTL